MTDARGERFTTLYGETRSRIVAYAVRRTASREDAADIVAEVYAVAWRRLDEVPEGHAGLLWLYVTARHLLANRERRLRRSEQLLERLAAELGDIPLAYAPHDEEGLMALICLNSLPENQREVLMLASWEGLRPSEIGRVLDCSPLAARLRLHRARTRLKAEMAEPSVAPKHRPAVRHEPSRDTTMGCADEEA
jgi:RNA polymerase sigma-70 factor (ECF subfamily)